MILASLVTLLAISAFAQVKQTKVSLLSCSSDYDSLEIYKTSIDGYKVDILSHGRLMSEYFSGYVSENRSIKLEKVEKIVKKSDSISFKFAGVKSLISFQITNGSSVSVDTTAEEGDKAREILNQLSGQLGLANEKGLQLGHYDTCKVK